MSEMSFVSYYGYWPNMKAARNLRAMRRKSSVTAMRSNLPATNWTDQFAANEDFPNLISANRFAKYICESKMLGIYDV